MGDLKQAEASLQDNLNGELRPASKEWRTRFSPWRAATQRRTPSRGNPATGRGLQRYPDTRQAIAARYLMADSARRLAMDLRKSAVNEISSAVRLDHQAESLGLLHRAMDSYTFLQDTSAAARART